MVLIAAPMASSGGSGITLLLPLILIVGMIWFMSRTQRKQRQKQADTVAALVPGTRVVTTSGQVGIVEEVDDEYVTLEIAEGVAVQFVKQAIGRVLPDEVDEYEEEEVEDADDLEELDETAADSTDARVDGQLDGSLDETEDDTVGDRDKVDAVDKPGRDKLADKPGQDKAQDQPKVPPTHTEN